MKHWKSFDPLNRLLRAKKADLQGLKPVGQNIGIGDKKRKMPVVKLTTAAMPYNFPERIFVIKLIF